jgi:hypothetical protein
MALGEGTWRAIDAVTKLLGAGIITAAVTWYGMKAEDSRQKIADTEEKSRREMAAATERFNAYIELSNKQKELDANLRMRMLETLMNHYFLKERVTGSPESVREKILLLRLMALNFQDVPLILAPLYEQLDGQLADGDVREAVRDIAREVARRQAFRLTFKGGFDFGPKKFKAGEAIRFTNLPFEVKVHQVVEGRVTVSLILEDQTIGPFAITYFDMPITDNVKLGDLRVALVLLSSRPQQEAVVRLIAFPSDLAEDRFDLKEISRKFRQVR